MKKKLITGKFVEVKCGCNSEWIPQEVGRFSPTRTHLPLYNSVPTHLKTHYCTKCGYCPWVEGDDIPKVQEAIRLADSLEE